MKITVEGFIWGAVHTEGPADSTFIGDVVRSRSLSGAAKEVISLLLLEIIILLELKIFPRLRSFYRPDHVTCA
jgi:hypothetical protein